ncbi:Cell wall assembly regulator SMI1 [Promicromonospora umidemergens]|uniref:SMI1/KNR4 family protein n=1 Tax=Promicromonospora umidemergens TaxID=629679 RepID=A0ABP8XCS1_9MICO|nr:SMI1/KNR4 family protein [Promicromonospora umidemergens]MCP2281753.1 Cell wall assembly regulator SMI1 [Promicromonospora umidemergens]
MIVLLRDWLERIPGLKGTAIVVGLAVGVVATVGVLDLLAPAPDGASPDGCVQASTSVDRRGETSVSEPSHVPGEDTLYRFETWQPLLELVRSERPELCEWSGSYSPGAYSVPLSLPPDDGTLFLALTEATEPLRAALEEAGKGSITFSVRIDADGRTVVTPAAESPTATVIRDFGVNSAGHVVLVDGAEPEPVRRGPEAFEGRGPAPSSDPEALERTLRERMPDAVGATEQELAALEERLGTPLPPELRALLRVTRAEYGDYGDYGEDDRYERDAEALGGIQQFDLDEIERASEADVRKGLPFDFLARTAVVTRPDSAVQGLVDSSEWIVIGDYGGTGDWVAVDLAPGPAGHVGQLVVLSHESDIGAWLLAESLTDLVRDGGNPWPSGEPGEEPPAVVMVDSGAGRSVRAAATDELEVLSVGSWDETPSDLSPLVGLPRLRTVTAEPGTIADPLVLGRLDHLEYLEIGLEDWRALIAADAVPESLLAAGISGYDLDQAEIDSVYDALIRQWGGDSLRTVTIEGELSP